MDKQWGGARKGAGRKQTPNKKLSISIQLSQEDIDFIDLCVGRSRSDKLRRIIKEYRDLKK